MKPITPDEIKKDIPSKVIKVFNDAIKKNWSGNSSVVKQNEVLEAVSAAMEVGHDVVLKNHWLEG